MNSAKVVSEKVRELEAVAQNIITRGISLIKAVPAYPNYDEETGEFYDEEWDWARLEGENKSQRNALLRHYEQWYTASLQLIKMYLPEKTQEFVKAYERNEKAEFSRTGVVNFLRLEGTLHTNTKDIYIEYLQDSFELQLRLLSCVPGIVEIQELSLRKVLSADYAKSELEEAEKLFGMGYHRAAGTIAGVVLERHLKTLCDIYGVAYTSKATIEPLAQALYSAGKFNITGLKQMQYLASIRNKCSHPGDVLQSEILSLIEGVNKLT